MTTAIVTTATAATESAASTTAATLGFRPSFVYSQCATADFLTTQAFDGRCGLTVIRHFYESESTGTSSIAISYYGNAIHCTKRREQIA